MYLLTSLHEPILPGVSKGGILRHDAAEFDLDGVVIGAAEGAFTPVAPGSESEVGVKGAHAHFNQSVLPGRVETVVATDTSGFSITPDGEPLIVHPVEPLEAFAGQLVFFVPG